MGICRFSRGSAEELGGWWIPGLVDNGRPWLGVRDWNHLLTPPVMANWLSNMRAVSASRKLSTFTATIATSTLSRTGVYGATFSAGFKAHTGTNSGSTPQTETRIRFGSQTWNDLSQEDCDDLRGNRSIRLAPRRAVAVGCVHSHFVHFGRACRDGNSS